jgi:tetratricopeptide (TPR) repeat protein
MRISALLIAVITLTVRLVTAQQTDVVTKESGTQYQAGLRLYHEGKYEQCIPYFQKAYRLDERNIAALFAHGLALNKLRKYREAAALFEKVLEKDPAHEKALRSLPMAYTAAGEEDKALAAYDRGIAAFPDDYYSYLGKAKVLIKLRNFREALPLLRKAHDLDSQRIETSEILAQTLTELGHMDEAYEIASGILKQDSNQARARIIAADYKRLKGRLEEALEDYRLATKDIETKAYAEHFIEVINQKLEEIEIEKEYEARLAARTPEEKNPSDSALTGVSETEPAKQASPSGHHTGSDNRKGGRLWLALIITAVVMALVVALAVRSYRRH